MRCTATRRRSSRPLRISCRASSTRYGQESYGLVSLRFWPATGVSVNHRSRAISLLA